MGRFAAQVSVDTNDLIDASSIGWSDVIGAIVAVIVGFALGGIARRLTKRALRRFPDMTEGFATIAARMVGWLVVLLGIVVGALLLGFNTGPMVIFLVIIGAVLFLSGRSLVENFGAGVILQTRAPFRLGDQIVHSDHTGVVMEINGRTTIIETPDGKTVHIANGDILRDPIVNLTAQGQRRSDVTVGVEYGTDLDRARAIIEAAVVANDGVFADPEPEVYAAQFGDSSIDFVVRYWHAPMIRDGYVVTDAVTRSIDRALKVDGIVIAFPQRVIWHGDGSGDQETDQ